MPAADYLFGPRGEAELRALTRSRALYAFDFDGTLAPIVTRPAQARLAPGVARRLQQLATRVPVAVVSGRGRDDVAGRLPPGVLHVIGNHGNEGPGGDGEQQSQARATVARWRAQFDGDADLRALLDAGAEVEDKSLSLSLHYRLARDAAAAEAALRAVAARLDPAPQVIGGKRVLNLLPPGLWTKYEALVALVQREQAEGVLFVGDDDTDEHVFAAAPAHWVTVRVELGRASRARYFVHQQSSVAMILDWLLRNLEQQQSPVPQQG